MIDSLESIFDPIAERGSSIDDAVAVPIRSRQSGEPIECEAEIVEAAKQGRADAIASLARMLLPRARNLVRYLSRGDDDVDDIVQEALVAVLRGLSSYRGDGSLFSWADRVIARATFGWLRQKRADAQAVSRSLREAPDDLPRPEPEVGPEDYLARRQVVMLLDALPFEQRHVLVLHHVCGMTLPEVAAATGVPLETARSRLRLGRQRLLAEAALASSRGERS